MKFKRAAIVAAVMTSPIGVSVATAEPASAREWPGYSWVYHLPAGNDQAIGIYCRDGSGPKWLQKGQDSSQKCGASVGASHYLIPANFDYYCRPSAAGGSGAWWIYHGPSSPAVPDGNNTCWSVHHPH